MQALKIVILCYYIPYLVPVKYPVLNHDGVSTHIELFPLYHEIFTPGYFISLVIDDSNTLLKIRVTNKPLE